MPKMKLSAFPSHGTVFCHVDFETRGPAGRRNNNPAKGWVVYDSHSKVKSPLMKNLKLAKKWAEERYEIVGWNDREKSFYKSVYAIPRPGFEAIYILCEQDLFYWLLSRTNYAPAADVARIMADPARPAFKTDWSVYLLEHET